MDQRGRSLYEDFEEQESNEQKKSGGVTLLKQTSIEEGKPKRSSRENSSEKEVNSVNKGLQQDQKEEESSQKRPIEEGNLNSDQTNPVELEGEKTSNLNQKRPIEGEVIDSEQKCAIEEVLELKSALELNAEFFDEMSQQALNDAVKRLETVATRLETLASRSPSGAPKGASAGEPEVSSPYVLAFDDLLKAAFGNFFRLSEKIGGDVKTMADHVSAALQQQRNFLNLASKRKEPQMNDLAKLLGPLSQKISAATEFREKSRGSAFFNHLSAISESIPGLGWVTVKPTPGPYVKEFADAATFYTNRVLKDFKEKDQTHVDWAKSWINSLTNLQAYIKEYHTTGVSWNPQGESLSASDSISGSPGGATPPPPPGGAPPPPPPPPPVEAVPTEAGGSSEEDAKNALFAQLNQGTDITKSLKKVSDDMKTHKNPALRQGPAPFKATQPPKPAPKPAAKVEPKVSKKPPVCELQDKKWVVEYQDGNNNIVIDQTNMKQTVYAYKCTNSAIMVKGKINSIILDSCKKVGVAFDDVVSSLEFINCQSVQGQVLGKMPTVSIDKTDGCLIYLSADSLDTEIVTAKSSEMNILVPVGDGDYKEFPLPEQFKTTWKDNKFVTEIAES